MKDIAPKITRQRLVIEGFFTTKIERKEINNFFKGMTDELKLRAYGKASIHSTGSKGKKINQGFDAFIPLIDSGIALYIWGNAKFFSTVIYTCKKFNTRKAVKFCKEFFKPTKITYQSF